MLLMAVRGRQDSESKLPQVERRKEKHFAHRDRQAVEQVALRGCAVSMQPIADPASSPRLDNRPPKVPSNPNFFYDFSMIRYHFHELTLNIKVMCMCLEDRCFLWSPVKHWIIAIGFSMSFFKN